MCDSVPCGNPSCPTQQERQADRARREAEAEKAFINLTSNSLLSQLGRVLEREDA